MSSPALLSASVCEKSSLGVSIHLHRALRCLCARDAPFKLKPMNKGTLWWLPLARRVLGWSLAGALLWFLVALPLLLAPVLVLGDENVTPTECDSGCFGPLLFVALIYGASAVACVLGMLGTLVGALAGVYAPPTDVKNPLRSRFFRCVHKQTFWFWLATSLVGAPTSAALVYFVVNPLIGQSGIFAVGCGLTFAGLLFILALWRALDRAIHAATASD